MFQIVLRFGEHTGPKKGLDEECVQVKERPHPTFAESWPKPPGNFVTYIMKSGKNLQALLRLDRPERLYDRCSPLYEIFDTLKYFRTFIEHKGHSSNGKE